MVAPIIAGVAALGGVVLGAILGKPKTLYAIVWIRRGLVEGKTFDSQSAAETYQDQIAARGRGSIMIERESGTYKGMRAIRAVAAGGKRVHPDKLRRMPASYERPTGAYSGPRMAANAASAFDTSEEALEVSQATTRLPEEKWSRRARLGPYPETNPGHQDYMPEAPLFDETTSSHMWKTEVDTWEVPGKYFPGGKNGGQPEMMVVTQALQYPEGDNADGGQTTSDAESKHNTEAKTHSDKIKRAKHDHHNPMVHQPDMLVEEFDESGEGIESESDDGRGKMPRVHQPKEMKIQ